MMIADRRGRESNLGPPEYEGMLTTRPRRSIYICMYLNANSVDCRISVVGTHVMRIIIDIQAGFKLTILVCRRPKPVHDLRNFQLGD
jgi:hypothetical protein